MAELPDHIQMKPLNVLVVMLSVVAVGATSVQIQFRASTALVRLEVSVTNDDGSIRGLGANDFVVEDGGVRQAIRVDELTDTPLDLVLVVPPLTSVAFIAADQTARVTAGVAAFLDQVQERDRLGAILAAPPPRRLRPLEAGPPPFGAEAFSVGNYYYSASFDAIALGLRVFDTSDRRGVLVAFTNAADFRSVIDYEAVADLAGRLGPAFVLVGTPVTIRQAVGASAEFRDGRPAGSVVAGHVSGGVFPAVLERLARRSGGITINLADADPEQLMARMFGWLRTHYVLTYELPGGKGWHPVRVKVNRRGVKVIVREGYFVD